MKKEGKGKFGQFWAILDKFGQVWASLDKFGQVWASLGKFGQVWASLGKFEQVWSSLIQFDPCSNNMFQIFMPKLKIPQNATNFSKMADDDYDYEKLLLRLLVECSSRSKMNVEWIDGLQFLTFKSTHVRNYIFQY